MQIQYYGALQTLTVQTSSSPAQQMPLCCLSEQPTRCDWWAEIDDYVTVKLNLFPEGNVHQIPFIFV